MSGSSSQCIDGSPILVTGAMRSGTTYLGRILSQASDVAYLHEPFNRVRGVVGVNHWFPFAIDEKDKYAALIDQAIQLRVRYRYVKQREFIKDAVRRIIGGRPQWYLWKYRFLVRSRARMLIKDPLAAFASAYLHDRHNASIVVLVRHPGAFYFSNKRLGWDFDFGHFLQQERLVKLYLHELEPELCHASQLSYPQRIGLLWQCIYHVLKKFGTERSHTGRWSFVTHEDLCTDTRNCVRSLAQELQITDLSSIERRLDDELRSTNPVEAPNNAVHWLRRDSRQLVDYWTSHVSSSELEDVIGMAGKNLLSSWY